MKALVAHTSCTVIDRFMLPSWPMLGVINDLLGTRFVCYSSSRQTQWCRKKYFRSEFRRMNENCAQTEIANTYNRRLIAKSKYRRLIKRWIQQELQIERLPWQRNMKAAVASKAFASKQLNLSEVKSVWSLPTSGHILRYLHRRHGCCLKIWRQRVQEKRLISVIDDVKELH